MQLTANATRSNGTVENVSSQATWRSSNRTVIDVNSSGVATALAKGESFISAQFSNRSASARMLVLPLNTYRLSGRISESGFGLSGVSVAVISGVGEGLTTVTDLNGNYALYGVAGHVRLHSKKDGYLNVLQELDVSSHVNHNFEMTAERARADVTGSYSLSIGVVGSCFGTLPDAARNRTYSAAVTQSGARLSVRLSGADFIVSGGRGDHFDGFLDLNGSISFQLGDPYYYYYYSGIFDLVERFTSTSSLVVAGTARVAPAGSGFSGTLSGAIMIMQGTTAPFFRSLGSCWGNAHRFEMQRQ